MSKWEPWFKTTLSFAMGQVSLKYRIPHDVFSTQRIDEGTVLFLEHLPPTPPQTVLDMGCGYGALGLPIAALFPQATVTMVDRDLLAVKWAQENAAQNHLSNVSIFGSLGFRDLPAQTPLFDWILCNVPARIGNPFIENLLSEGRARLSPKGELRVVVINDLVPTLFQISAQNDWTLIEVKKGPRHSILSLSSNPAPASGPLGPPPRDLYLRDQISVGELLLDRPTDFGGDDVKRTQSGLPLLMDALPRATTTPAPTRILIFRPGYGQIALLCRKRWPTARVVCVDRDLLGTTFIRRNAEKLELSGAQLDIREAAHFPEALLPDERFDLIAGELSSSAGEQVAIDEIINVRKHLKPGGEALFLCLEKAEKEWLKPFSQKQQLPLYPVMKRNGYVVLSLRGVRS